MANSSSQVRQKLLQGSLDCVKKCQVRYGGQAELATGEDGNVVELCKQVEIILIHGLRDRDDSLGLAVMRNVRELVVGGEGVARNLWNLLKKELNPQEQQRFLLLNNISTDQGRARAWIRSSLNEQSLERFLQTLLKDITKLNFLYEEWALMRDPDRSGMLPSLAAGLTSVRFALKIDDPCLNSELEGVPQVLNSFSSLLPSFKPQPTSAKSSQPQIAQDIEDEHVIKTTKVRSRVKKKKLKSAAQVVSFDEKLVCPAEVADEAVAVDIYSPFSTQSTDDSFLFPEREKIHPDVSASGNNPFAPESYASDRSTSEFETLAPASYRSSTSSVLTTDREDFHDRRTDPPLTVRSATAELSPLTIDRDQLERLTLSYEPVNLTPGSMGSSEGGKDQDDIDIYNRSSTSGNPESDTKSDSSSSQFGSALTPVTNKDIGALFLVHPGTTCRESLDFESFEQADLDYAPSPSPSQELVLETANQSKLSANSDNISTCSGVSSRSNRSLGKDDLRKALLSVMEKKEELETQLKLLRSSLESEHNTTRDLKIELENVTQTKQEQIEKLESRNSILSRENELLKHQLKKYVGAVQKLRDGPQAYETLARLEIQNDSNEISGKYVDYHFEASEYEKKLIQVAEMHGELLEFNETLQRSVQTRDQVICRLRSELVELRGPLPEDQDNWDSSSLASSFSEVSVSNSSRVLVNIWVPSVFLAGAGSTRHHVYQVYIRIRDAEWNVYRRYNQFLELHHTARRTDPVVASFHFPPKKHLGNRSERFVESRRIQLQTYLRNIVNYMVGTHPTLANCPDKDTLVAILPFFSDAPDPTHDSSRRSRGSLTRLVI